MIRPIIHEDPKPEVKAITIDRTEVTKPAPLQELPRTGGTDGALLGGFFLMLGGASIMLGGRAAGNDWRRTT
jgi:hypothetical protein